MTRLRYSGALALMAVCASVGLSACGSDDKAEDRTAMIDGKPVQEAIAELGGSCDTSGMAGRMSCTYKGVVFALSPNSWETKAGQRERECNTEQVSPTKQVLTNHRWVMTADEESALESLRDALVAAGSPSEVVGYCDWDAGE